MGAPEAQAGSATASKTKAMGAGTVGRTLGGVGRFALDRVNLSSGEFVQRKHVIHVRPSDECVVLPAIPGWHHLLADPGRSSLSTHSGSLRHTHRAHVPA